MNRFAMTALVAAALGAVTAPAAVLAQRAATPTAPVTVEAPADQAAPPAGEMKGPGEMRGPGRDQMQMRHRGMGRGMDIAARLAATETYIGITPDQQESWGAYSQAVIAFFEPGPDAPDPAADPASDAEAGDAPAGEAEAGDADQSQRLLGPERFARATLERAGKAEAVIEAATALRAELTPDQLDRLLKSEPGFDRGRRGRHGHHHGGERGPRAGGWDMPAPPAR